MKTLNKFFNGSSDGCWPFIKYHFCHDILFMLRLNLERLATQVVKADLASYLGSKLKLEQEDFLKSVLSGISFLPCNGIKIQVKEMKIFYLKIICA